MQVNEILAEIDREIERLQQARNLLAGSPARRTGGRRAAAPAAPKPETKKRGKRRLSAEGRRRISEALKKRWAERKKASAKTSAKTAK